MTKTTYKIIVSVAIIYLLFIVPCVAGNSEQVMWFEEPDIDNPDYFVPDYESNYGITEEDSEEGLYLRQCIIVFMVIFFIGAMISYDRR